MSGKLKREAKSCLFFVYQAGLGSLRQAKSFLLFVYMAGPESLKDRQKVVYCSFIGQGQKV